MKSKTLLLPLLSLTLFLTCNKSEVIDHQAMEQELLEVHKLARKYHVEKMVNEFVSQLSDKHISVNRGKMSKLQREKKTNQVQQYFDSVEFEKWDDIEPPIIRFSDDYSMAYTIVNKEVVLTYTNENNENIRESTLFSWVAIYTKQNGVWKTDCVASTNQESVTSVIN
ncbi:hypothetical protein AAFP94_11930 [Flavobacteriaceae bacterium MJ-SS4]|uniref:hypothetical protein n=1 Tax=Gilvirhabdus luticola TaxID=3079858 RepID=UPI0032DCFD4B